VALVGVGRRDAEPPLVTWTRPWGRWLGLGALWVGIPLGAAEAVASPVMLFGLFGWRAPHQFGKDPMWVYAWAYYLWSYPDNPAVKHWALMGGGGALTVMLLVASVVLSSRQRRGESLRRQSSPLGSVPAVQRAKSNIYGSARWMEISEARRFFPKVKPRIGGIPLAELVRVDLDPVAGRTFNPEDKGTWTKTNAKMLIDPMRRGRASAGIIISGSGGGKTAAFTIPALHQYRASMVINDPSGSASHITSAYREDIGHKVAIIDPAFPALGAMNILKTIDLQDRMASMMIKAFVTEAAGPAKADATKEENFFKNKGISLNTALLIDLLYDPHCRHKTVREWRQRIVTPDREMRSRLEHIYAHSNVSYARDVAGELMDTHAETLSGIRSHATGDTEWLSYDPLATLLSEDTFDPAEIIKGKMTIFMQFPSWMLLADPSIARVVLGSLMRIVMKTKGHMPAPVPFVIDECYQLKHIHMLAVGRDEGRHVGMPLYTMWQSEGQIDEVWGAGGKKAWFTSAAWRMYIGGIDDPATAGDLSDALGTYTALVPSEGDNSSQPAGAFASGRATRGRNQNLSLQPRKLASKDELRTQIRGDEAVLILRNQRPGRFKLANWYQRDDMVASLRPDPKYQTEAVP
jgi:type IV secretion system protein VirD4